MERYAALHFILLLKKCLFWGTTAQIILTAITAMTVLIIINVQEWEEMGRK